MRISIVVPCFNAQTYIGETLQSIRAAGHRVQLIVVDGGSTDRTVAIAKQYEPDVLISERDQGQSDAINKGMARASGDLLAWQNADDIYLSGFADRLAQAFHRPADIFYGNYDLIDHAGKLLTSVTAPEWQGWKLRYGRFVPMQPTCFWRRAVYEAVGPLDVKLRYCMDVDFFARAQAANFRFERLPYRLGAFRMHEGSLTTAQTPRLKIAREHEMVLRRHAGLGLPGRGIFWLLQAKGACVRRLRTGMW